MTETKFYPFEEDGNRAKAEVSPDDESLVAFYKRLDIGPVARTVFDSDIKAFVLHVIHNINWYKEALAEESRRKSNFFKLTVFLAGSMPIATAVLPFLLPEKSFGYTLIAGLLASVLALQRTLSSWLKQRKVEAVFSEAASQLKELLYDFEDKWAGILTPVVQLQENELETSTREKERAQLNDRGREFARELQSVTVKAREIASEERVRFFEASAPVVKLQQVSPSIISGRTTTADTAAMSKFTFEDGGFTEQEKEQILRNHKRAYACIEDCEHLTEDEKTKLFDTYNEAIEHYPISTPNVFGEAIVGGVSIGINKTLLLSQHSDQEISQTLIHEMMHCAGFKHRKKTAADKPGDGGEYYNSRPLIAELCIAGVQSDSMTVASEKLLSCKGGIGKCEIGSA